MKSRNTTLVWGLLIGLAVLLAGWSQISPVYAQGDDETETTEDEPGPAKAAKGDGQAAAEPEQENTLMWLIRTSGWIGAVILVLSIYFVATTVRMFMELRPEVLAPPEVIEEAEKLMQARDFTGLYKRLKADDSFFSTVVSAGITELPNGLPDARDAMERVGEVNTIGLERKISMLAVIGTLGPMIGLLGTLMGMIESFGSISRSGTQLKASEVAGGISKALVLTFEGVALSVPAIYFFALFRNRISSFGATTMLDADAFVRRLYTVMKSKPPAGAPAAAPPAAPPVRT